MCDQDPSRWHASNVQTVMSGPYEALPLCSPVLLPRRPVFRVWFEVCPPPPVVYGNNLGHVTSPTSFSRTHRRRRTTTWTSSPGALLPSRVSVGLHTFLYYLSATGTHSISFSVSEWLRVRSSPTWRWKCLFLHVQTRDYTVFHTYLSLFVHHPHPHWRRSPYHLQPHGKGSLGSFDLKVGCFHCFGYYCCCSSMLPHLPVWRRRPEREREAVRHSHPPHTDLIDQTQVSHLPVFVCHLPFLLQSQSQTTIKRRCLHQVSRDFHRQWRQSQLHLWRVMISGYALPSRINHPPRKTMHLPQRGRHRHFLQKKSVKLERKSDPSSERSGCGSNSIYRPAEVSQSRDWA